MKLWFLVFPAAVTPVGASGIVVMLLKVEAAALATLVPIALVAVTTKPLYAIG
jgi:hypothetical protein